MYLGVKVIKNWSTVIEDGPPKDILNYMIRTYKKKPRGGLKQVTENLDDKPS